MVMVLVVRGRVMLKITSNGNGLESMLLLNLRQK